MTISFFNSSESTAETITLPASIASGDVIILYDRSSGFSNPGTTIPTGFTEISMLTDGGQNSSGMSYKIANGTEGGTTITGLGGSGNDIRKIAIVFRSDTSISAVNVADIGEALQNSDPADQAVSAGSGSAPLAIVAGYGASGTVDPRSFSPSEDAEIGITGETDFYLKYKIYNASPADVTVGMDDEGFQNGLFSFYIEFTETAGTNQGQSLGVATVQGVAKANVTRGVAARGEATSVGAGASVASAAGQSLAGARVIAVGFSQADTAFGLSQGEASAVAVGAEIHNRRVSVLARAAATGQSNTIKSAAGRA